MASRNSGHIRVTIIDSIPLSSHARCLINICTGFISSGVCFIFAYYILKDTLWAISAGITLPALGWPAAIQELSLAIGLGLMALHHLDQSVRALWKA